MSAGRPGRPRPRRRRRVGVVYVLPATVLFATFFVVPLALTVWIALHDWPLLGHHEFVGLHNFAALATDGRFLSAVRFTLGFALVIVPLLFGVGLLLALLLQRPGRGIGVLRTAVFLPVSLGYASASYLWLSLLNSRVGVLNWLSVDLGLVDSPVNWFDTTGKAVGVAVLVTLWKFAGFPMVAFINGLNAIPAELDEAAQLDGASRFRTFFAVKLPLLRPTVAFVLTFLLVTAFLTFDQFYILTAGGPRNSTITIVHWIYTTSFVRGDLGYGAAMSLVFLVLVGLVNVVQRRALRAREA